jgi:2,4-dichlorophenol 6-monooxygenase
MGDVYQPTTRPGHRLPHAWIEGTGKAGEAGERVSTHDLTGRGTSFALLTGPGGEAWSEAAEQVAAKFGITIRTARIGAGGDWADPEGTWARVREIADDGAVLVRPDNHVAWRSFDAVEAPADVLALAVQTVLNR